MFLLIPFHVDVPMQRWPWANVLILLFTTLFYFGIVSETISPTVARSMVHDGWKLTGMFGHILLHGDILHLLGNMLFLWVFGNAICAKLGNVAYPFVYVALALVAAITDLIIEGGKGIGASGAINGVVGMFLVLYPRNNITCFYWLFLFYIVKSGTFSIDSRWMIIMWFAFDVWGAVMGGGNVGYIAHLGGFAGGFALAWGRLHFGVIESSEYERTLPEILQGVE